MKSWKNKEDRKAFFDDFAASKGFNPPVPDNWYKVSPKALLSYQVNTRKKRVEGGQHLKKFQKNSENRNFSVLFFPKEISFGTSSRFKNKNIVFVKKFVLIYLPRDTKQSLNFTMAEICMFNFILLLDCKN